MLWSLSLALVVGAIMAIALLTGRAVLTLLYGQPRPESPAESCAAAAIVGTASWIISFAWLSHLGLSTPWIALILMPGVIALLGVAVWRHRPTSVLLPVLQREGLVMILVAYLAGLVLLLPLVVGNTYPFINDTILYDGASIYLQHHPMETNAPPPHDAPMQLIGYHLFQSGRSLGTAFLLALVQAFFLDTWSIAYFPAVAAWGMSLNLFAVFLFMRQTIGLDHLLSLVASTLICVSPNPVQSGAAHGFLMQTYGCPAILFSLNIFRKSLSVRSWDIRDGALLALGSTFALNVYQAIFPVFAIIGTVLIVAGAILAFAVGVARRWLAVMAATGCMWIVLSNIEIIRAKKDLELLIGVVAGWNILWSFFDFLAFFFGTRLGGPQSSLVLADGVMTLGATALAIFLFALGGWRCVRQRNTVIIVSLIVWSSMVAYYVLIARNPWTGDRVHVWSLHKLAQWSFPLILSMQAAGLAVLASKAGDRAVAGLALLAVVAGGWASVVVADDRAAGSRSYMGFDRPMEAMDQVRAAVDLQGADTVYLLGPMEQYWRKLFYASALAPRPVVSIWRHAPTDGFLRPEVKGRPVYVAVGYGGLAWKPSQELVIAPGMALVREPILLGVYTRGGAQRGPDGLVRVGRAGEVLVSAGSPYEGRGVLTFTAWTEDGATEGSNLGFQITTSSGCSLDVPVSGPIGRALTIPLDAGETDIILKPYGGLDDRDSRGRRDGDLEIMVGAVGLQVFRPDAAGEAACWAGDVGSIAANPSAR